MIMEGITDNFDRFLEHLKGIHSKKNDAEKENIRNFVAFIRRSNSETVRRHSSRNINLVKLIVEVLASGILHQEVQVLLSTALCILLKSAFEDETSDEILCECITCGSILLLPSPCGSPGPSVFVNRAAFFRLCVTWSTMQCFGCELLKKFYVPHLGAMKDKKISPFMLVFDLMEEHCNAYTNATYMSFKLLPVWLRRMEELCTLNLIDEPYFIIYIEKVFRIVNNNWENSVPGVRPIKVEILRKVFGIIAKIGQDGKLSNDFLNLPNALEIIMLEVPWRMKCKYVMLTAILQKYGIKEALTKFPSIPSGLIYSLYFPNLVSAGADSYREIIKEITLDQWMTSFYCLLKTVMIGKDRTARDNLMSYWIPDTLKALPLAIEEILSDLLKSGNLSSLFSAVSLFRIGRKFGLLEWKQMDYELLKELASHLSEDVRGQAFAAVCVCTKTTLIPAQGEIDLVCLFLEENINVDSAQLRQSTVTSFKVFICRLKSAYCCSCLENNSTEGRDLCEAQKIIGFFHWLLKFIMNNFVPGTNYQRRITSICLLQIVLDNICLLVANKSHRKELRPREYFQRERWLRNEVGLRFKGISIFNILLRCIMGSVADIRDVASVILKGHFDPPSKDLFHKLWKKALSVCSSSMFYEIESGAVLAECLIHWRFCEKTITLSDETMPFVDTLLSIAEEQKAQLEQNVLRGASCAPVHGILNILHRIVSSPDILSHLEMKEVQAKRLMNFVDSLINFALGVLSSKPDAELDMAPSFAEMGIAIDCAVHENAKCLDEVEVDELFGASELVLNCIWLNLKVCCQLASALATNLSQNKWGPLIEEHDVEFCGHLIIRVLMKCRHKGAIESAGKSLSAFAIFCASNPNPRLKELPLKMLNYCLEQTVGRKEGRASITRRSAGLSILVQKLIVADSKNTIPVCIPKLLSWSEMDFSPEFCNDDTVDLPQTQALHFLRAIVQDADVYQYISPYMSEIALVCFKNFNSGIWAIRNAALQLFGAVVPKLIGQKKGQAEDIVGSNVTVEELNTHYPALMNYLLKELKESVTHFSQDENVTSPNLLPILFLCSRLTLGISQLRTPSFSQLILDFQSQFLHLLSSPNIAVRKSCAKSISAFTPLIEIPAKIEALIVDLLEGCSISENGLHGKLLCLKALKDRFEVDYHLLEEYETKCKRIQSLIENKSITGKLSSRCYFTRALLCEIQGFTCSDIHAILHTVKEKSQGFYPGLLLWAAISLKYLILTCADESLYNIVQGCFQSGNHMLEACLQSLSNRLEKFHLSDQPNHEIYVLLDNACDSQSSINVVMYCLNSMLHICSKSSLTLSLDRIISLFEKFVTTSNYGVGCSSIALSLISSQILKNNHKNTKLMAVKVVSAIHEQSLPSNLEEIRLKAVRNLLNFLPLIHSYQEALQGENLEDLISEEIVSSLLNTAVCLLQDENVEVRKEVAKFVTKLITNESTISCTETVFNPQKCLTFLLTQISSFLPLRVAIKCLWEYLTNILTVQELEQYSPLQYIRNPFDHRIENVFEEKVIITKYSGDSLKGVINGGKHTIADIKAFLNVAHYNIFETAAFLLSKEDLRESVHAHAEIYRVFLSIKYQLEIAILLDMESSTALKLLSRLESLPSNVYEDI
ncbi:tRNA (32-2'-O)-methyltransferase regulator THADA [Hetaerina americana]|uniref:tRNA (32-2'-O)-methyltransferase regulator THADA n=1 Tax=Hetaerina americana TaxID=62018 RepID=UPI003A7F1581